MDKKNKKSLILLLVLLLIFVFTLVRALKPVKPKTIVVSSPGEGITTVRQENSSSKENRILSFQEMDQSISKVQSLVKSIDQQDQQVSTSASYRDPFLKPGAKQTLAGTRPSEYTSILVQEIPAPDFKISGIVYDKEKPMVILDDEIKAEKETKSGYTVEKILPDRVILKYKDKQFVLYVNNGKNVEGTELKMTDIADDTEISMVAQKGSDVIEKKNKITEMSANLSEDTSILKESRISTTSFDEESRKEKIFTVQVASFSENKKEIAINLARKLVSDGYMEVRVEKINGMYTVRIGKSDKIDGLIPLYEQMKEYSETSFVRKAFYIEERIIFPPEDKVNMNM
ncbi:MAG: SPOR domain-containing protein [Candidatus Ratteibacteria bacterium]